MRRREAIIDPARVKRKEARGISREERREGGRARDGVAASLAAGSPQRFVHQGLYVRRSWLTKCQPRFHGLKGWTDRGWWSW